MGEAELVSAERVWCTVMDTGGSQTLMQSNVSDAVGSWNNHCGTVVPKVPFQGQSPPQLYPGRRGSILLCPAWNKAGEETQEGAQNSV